MLISDEIRQSSRSSGSSKRTTSTREESKNSNAGAGGYQKYQIFGLANPRSGDGLASGFLTDYPPVNEKSIYIDKQRGSV